MKLYHHVKTAAEAERIATAGFTTEDRVMMTLPSGIQMLGIIFSTEMDPRSHFGVELNLPLNPDFLKRHEVKGPALGVRYFLLPLDVAAFGQMSRVPDEQFKRARRRN
jgi:hypothetical protein